MKRNIMKKVGFAICALFVMCVGFGHMSAESRAESSTIVKYQPVTYSNFEKCINASEAPKCELNDNNGYGYLFGGWYTYDDNKAGKVITKLSDVEKNADNIVAKFVPSYLARVSCQVGADVEVQGVNSTNMRIVSVVDSTNYAAVGFNIYGRADSDKDGVYTEWLMYKYDSQSTNLAESTKVYSGLKVYEVDDNNELKYSHTSTTSNVFGQDAEGFYFTTACLTGIPKNSYDTIISIKPYWITMDGTVVEGMGEFDRVQDNIDGIVNVSVNLKDAKTIAAGMLSVAYDETYFTYKGCDYGRVFDEMTFHVNGETVNCVGNVGDINDNATEPNDIYANLRFEKTEAGKGLEVGKTTFTVTVPEKGFCDKDEKIQSISAWNLKY